MSRGGAITRGCAVGAVVSACLLVAASSPAKPKKPRVAATSLEDAGSRKPAPRPNPDGGVKVKDSVVPITHPTSAESGDSNASPVNACAKSLLALEALVRFAPATCKDDAECEAQAATCSWSYVRKSPELASRLKSARDSVKASCPENRSTECAIGTPSGAACIGGTCAAAQRAPGTTPRTTRTVKPVGFSGVR